MKYILKAIFFCVVFAGLFVGLSFAKNSVPANFERFAHGVIGTLVAFFTTLLFLKFDKKRFSNIGLSFDRNTIAKFFLGVITGVVIMGFLAAIAIYFSNVEITVNPGSSVLNFLVMTSPLIPLAFMEELGFRAYPLETLKDKIGIRLSILITSILFALYHVANGWTLANAFYGPAVWGLVFGLAAIRSKGIAMPTGIHYAANLTTSAFGAANNNVCIWTIKKADISTVKYQGPDWATILPSLILLTFGILCIEWHIRRKTTATYT